MRPTPPLCVPYAHMQLLPLITHKLSHQWLGRSRRVVNQWLISSSNFLSPFAIRSSKRQSRISPLVCQHLKTEPISLKARKGNRDAIEHLYDHSSAAKEIDFIRTHRTASTSGHCLIMYPHVEIATELRGLCCVMS